MVRPRGTLYEWHGGRSQIGPMLLASPAARLKTETQRLSRSRTLAGRERLLQDISDWPFAVSSLGADERQCLRIRLGCASPFWGRSFGRLTSFLAESIELAPRAPLRCPTGFPSNVSWRQGDFAARLPRCGMNHAVPDAQRAWYLRRVQRFLSKNCDSLANLVRPARVRRFWSRNGLTIK